MSSPCRELLFNPEWHVMYRAAMSLSTIGVSRQAVSSAEEAVLARIQEISQRGGPEVEVERDELEDALYTLRALKNSQVYTIAA